MRVGIVTLNGNHNYGNRLQLYASSVIYSSLGFEVVNLLPADDLFTNEIQQKKVKQFVKKIISINDKPASESLMSSRRLRAFHNFSASIPEERISKSMLNELHEKFDFFSVGSDQVWNPDYCKYRDDWYYLKFALRKQRIALSPSIGVQSLNGAQRRRLKRGVEGFERLSVRESRGAELIKDASGRTAEVIADPTLVVAREKWRNVANDSLTPKHPYVFTYLLGGESDSTRKLLKKVTSGGDIPCVSLSDRQKPGELDAGPSEFISLIDRANHVVTDSFHAAVFASMLQTPLTIVRRVGNVGMFSRLEQLSRMLGIKHTVYGSSEYDYSRANDYEGVFEAIEREQKRFFDYLEACLDG